MINENQIEQAFEKYAQYRRMYIMALMGAAGTTQSIDSPEKVLAELLNEPK